MLLNANIQDKRVLYTPETLDVELASESESFIKSKRYQQLKATHLKNSAYYYQILEQPKKALVYLDKAFLLLKDLIKDAPNDYKHYASLAETELLIAKQSKNINDLNSMKKYCLSAKRRLESIQKKDKDPQYLYPYAKALDCLGELETSPTLLKQLKAASIKDIKF